MTIILFSWTNSWTIQMTNLIFVHKRVLSHSFWGYFQTDTHRETEMPCLGGRLVCCQPLDQTCSEIKLQSAISAAVVQLVSAEGLIWKRNGFSKIQRGVCNLSIHSFHFTSTVLYLNNVYYILPHTWEGKAILLQLIDSPGHNTSTSSSVWRKRHNLLIKLDS